MPLWFHNLICERIIESTQHPLNYENICFCILLFQGKILPLDEIYAVYKRVMREHLSS